MKTFLMTCCFLVVGLQPTVMAQNKATPASPPRPYHREVTEEEATKVRYIITTLGKQSGTGVILHILRLRSVGAQIDHLHPLRFLLTIFTDEGMKASMQNIAQKGWAWEGFMDGVRSTMSVEHPRGNVEPFIEHFSQCLDINPELVSPPIQRRDWEGLVKVLIVSVPRYGDTRRFDM